MKEPQRLNPKEEPLKLLRYFFVLFTIRDCHWLNGKIYCRVFHHKMINSIT